MRCQRCSAMEGEKHPTAAFEVELEPVDVKGSQKMLCQKCRVRVQSTMRNARNNEKQTLKEKILALFR